MSRDTSIPGVKIYLKKAECISSDSVYVIEIFFDGEVRRFYTFGRVIAW